MSTQSVAPVNPTSQASPFPDTCKRCGSSHLFTKIEPPHVALRCRDCNAWQSWISKSKARRFQVNKVRLTVPSKTYPQTVERIGPAVVDPSDLCVRVERLERAFTGYDSQLGILVKAILACGVLQGKGGAPSRVNVDEGLVNELVAELSEDQ
jgi:hypothetical protein